MEKILVLHGPNLNLLGTRETSVYGHSTLSEIDQQLHILAQKEGVELTIEQSNSEGDLVNHIQVASGRFDAIVINPAAYTHTSVALRDAITSVSLPTVEVHLSNIYQREDFRRHSFIAEVAMGQISGFGPYSYHLGLLAAIGYLRKKGQSPNA